VLPDCCVSLCALLCQLRVAAFVRDITQWLQLWLTDYRGENPGPEEPLVLGLLWFMVRMTLKHVYQQN
jgi:hypothetical protein